MTLAVFALVLFGAACGGSKKTSATPTTAPPAASPTPSGPRATAEDPTGDCIGAQGPIACEPAALDMRRFTVEKDAAGNFVFTLEITAGGFPALGAYTLLIGIDTDKNATTGQTGYASFHGLAPEIELNYTVAAGQPPRSSVRTFTAPGPAGQGDASLVEWKQIDATHLQAAVKPALLNNVTSFWVITDLNISDRYDHMPDDARISFPDGAVLRK